MDEGTKTTRFRRRITMVLLLAYSLFVALLTLTPQMPGAGFVSRAVDRVLASLYARGLPTSIDFLTIEFIGNILMFVPLGFLTAMLIARRSWWVLLFIGTLMSAVIELSQLLFLIDRFPEVRDLVSNTTGFVIGATCAVTLRLMVAHRDTLVERDRRDAVAASSAR